MLVWAMVLGCGAPPPIEEGPTPCDPGAAGSPMAALPDEALASALPERGGRWTAVAQEARGGMATATYTLDGQRADGPPGLTPTARVVIEDEAARCRVAPGTGTAMLDHEARLPDHQRATVGGRAAIVARAAGTLQAHVWVADRCAVTIGASAGTDEALTVTGEDLEALAAGVPWADLERVCGAR